MKKSTELRMLINREGAVVLPGVYDCLSAKLAEEAQHSAIFTTGAGIAASVLGCPDFGLITMSEVLSQTKNIVKAVNIPVLADCDTGYGNPINVYRTVKEFQDVGVGGLFIEDQIFPKRCGHFEKKEVILMEDMVTKIEAAVDARTDPDLVIMARTDARAMHGLDAAIDRSNAYVEAGADMIFVEAPRSLDELEKIPKRVRAPTMVNMVEGGKTPLVTVQELTAMGFKFISFSGSAQKIAITAMRKVFRALQRDGCLDSVISDIASLDERSKLLNLAAFYEMERKYGIKRNLD